MGVTASSLSGTYSIIVDPTMIIDVDPTMNDYSLLTPGGGDGGGVIRIMDNNDEEDVVLPTKMYCRGYQCCYRRRRS
jgi:hypothetical protein